MSDSKNVTAKTATLVARKDGNGDGRLYRLDPPMKYDERGWIGDDYVSVDKQTEHVWVSAVVVPFSGPETYIFASDSEGNVLDWSELPGSLRGSLDHAEALRGAGYEVSA